MNQELKEIEDTLKMVPDGEMTVLQAMTRIEEIVEDALNPVMTPITPGMTVRAPEEWELEQLAVACACERCERNNYLPTKDEVQEERDFLSQAGISVIEGYMTDSPGYCGPVYCVVWSGGPEIHTTYVIEKGRLVPATEGV